VRGKRVDGLVIANPRASERQFVDELLQEGFPVVAPGNSAEPFDSRGALGTDSPLPPARRAWLLAQAMPPAELAGKLLAHDANPWAASLPADDMGALYNALGPRLPELARGLRQHHRLNVPVLFALDRAHGHAKHMTGYSEGQGGRDACQLSL
jgi:hypothetical protein